MNKNSQHTMYRVYDHKNNYTQSYSSEFLLGFKWAKDCAIRMNGRVDQIEQGEAGESTTTVFSFSPK
jgi:hypothetical protein